MKIDIHWGRLIKFVVSLSLVLIGANVDAWWGGWLVGGVVGVLCPSAVTIRCKSLTGEVAA